MMETVIKIPQWLMKILVGVILSGALAWASHQTVLTYTQAQALTVVETKQGEQAKQLDRIEAGVNDMNKWLREHPNKE